MLCVLLRNDECRTADSATRAVSSSEDDDDDDDEDEAEVAVGDLLVLAASVARDEKASLVACRHRTTSGWASPRWFSQRSAAW